MSDTTTGEAPEPEVRRAPLASAEPEAAVRERVIEINLAKSSSPIDNSIACRHAVMTFHPVSRIKVRVQAMTIQVNPAQMISSMESMN
jgi:hypothetical protein